MGERLYLRKVCRCCGSSNVTRSIPLAKVPIVSPNVGIERDSDGRPTTELVAPLDNYLCADCGLIQLLHVVDPSLIYREYMYRTSVSLGLAEHFHALGKTVIKTLSLEPGALVVEFGSNDGTLLQFFKEAGMRIQGVDPAKAIAAEATARGVPTVSEFFTERLAGRIALEQGRARVVMANNAMANIDDLGDVLRGVKTLLAENGAFVFETQYALDVFEKFLLDVIYHEHISCFSVRPVVETFGGYGLEVFDAERIPTKGGSIRFWIQHAGGPMPVASRVGELIDLEWRTGLYDLNYHRQFSQEVARIKAELHNMIEEVRRNGKKIAAFGTSVGCAALIHQFELEDKLDMLFDDKPFKERIEGPGYSLPVLKGDRLADEAPGLVVILAWRYAEPIISRGKAYSDKGGQWIVPLPSISVAPQRM